MLTYAGYPLAIPTPEIAAWIEANISPRDVYEFQRLYAPGLHHAGLLVPGQTPERPVKIGKLFMPGYGASQWGVGHFLADEATVKQLRARVFYQADGGYLANYLVIDDEAGGRLSTPLFMLPPRPLQQWDRGSKDELLGFYLLTLVDERFFWWDYAATLDFDEGVDYWSDLYAEIASALGITLTVDTVNTPYLGIKPTARLVRDYLYLPLLLDTVAAAVGQRIVRKNSGNYYTRNATTALSEYDDQADTARKQAGGILGIFPYAPFNDWQATVPESVTVLFPRSEADLMTTKVYALENSLEDLDLTSGSQFGQTTGRTGSHLLHTVYVANFSDSADTTPDNSSDYDAIATALSKAWYLWQLGKADIVYPGVFAWEPDGLHSVEWTCGDEAERFCTRVQRQAWNELQGAGYAADDDPLVFRARVAGTSNINLSSLPSTIDSVTMAAGDVFLATAQTSAPAKGLYVYSAASGTATRLPAADTSAEFNRGQLVNVLEGTSNSGLWRLDTKPTITLGSTSLSYSKFGGVSYSFAVGTSGTDFDVTNSGGTVTYNLPAASETAAGKITTGLQHLKGEKTLRGAFTIVVGGAFTIPSYEDGFLHFVDPSLQHLTFGRIESVVEVTGSELLCENFIASDSSTVDAFRCQIGTRVDGDGLQRGALVLMGGGTLTPVQSDFGVRNVGLGIHWGKWDTVSGLEFAGGLFIGGSLAIDGGTW